MRILIVVASLIVLGAILYALKKACPKCSCRSTIEKVPARISSLKHYCRACHFFFAVLLLVAAPAVAADKAVTVQGGWQHTPNSNYGDGAVVAARAEAPMLVNQYGVLDGGLEYAYHGQTNHYGYGFFSGHSLLAEAIYYPPVKWAASPYILGGLGWSWWNFDENAYLRENGINVSLGSNVSEKIGAGLNYPLGHDWSLNVEWCFFQVNVPKDSGSSNVVGGSKVGHGETDILVGLRRAF